MRFEEIQKTLLQYFEEHQFIRILLPFNLIIMFVGLAGVVLSGLGWLGFAVGYYSYFLVVFLFGLILTATKGDYKMSLIALIIKLVETILETILYSFGFLSVILGLCAIIIYIYLTYQVYNKTKNI